MNEKPKIFLITGLSGAGKTFLLRNLEDEGYYTVDNVPPHLIRSFLNIVCTSEITKLAIVSDIRWKNVEQLKEAFLNISNYTPCDIEVQKVFLEADKKSLITRFKKSRRSHPISNLDIDEAIEKEKNVMNSIKMLSDIIIDTSNTEPYEFRKKFFEIINEDKRTLKLNVVSFGFKNGIPESADYVFDVRFLPNPYYIFDMYKLNGLDEKVVNYLESFNETNETLKKLVDLAKFIQDSYTESGRVEAYFCIGCTGGQHRSVYIAENIFKLLKKEGRDVTITHREMSSW